MTRHARHREGLVGDLRVATEHVDGVQSVAIGIWIGVGARDEPVAMLGCSHFVEHMLFKGNERRDAEKISRHFDAIGADANAATGKEHTVLHTRVLSRHLPETLDVLGEMVLAPAFAPVAVEAERDVILQEMAMYDDTPSDVVHELIDALVFTGHELARPIVGSRSSVTALTPADLRVHHAAHYVPSSMVITAVGDVAHDAFIELVRSTLDPEHWADGPDVKRSAPPAPGGPRSAIIARDTEQVHLCCGGRGVSRVDDRRYAASVLDVVLGGSTSSRLFTEIRERRGLAYSVFSYIAQYADTGSVGVSLAVRPDRLGDSLTILRREFERLIVDDVAADELQRAKDHLEGRMVLALESTGARNGRLGSSLVSGLPVEPVATIVERVRAVTADDVRTLAGELLEQSGLSIAAVAEDVDAVRSVVAEVFDLETDTVELEAAYA